MRCKKVLTTEIFDISIYWCIRAHMIQMHRFRWGDFKIKVAKNGELSQILNEITGVFFDYCENGEKRSVTERSSIFEPSGYQVKEQNQWFKYSFTYWRKKVSDENHDEKNKLVNLEYYVFEYGEKSIVGVFCIHP